MFALKAKKDNASPGSGDSDQADSAHAVHTLVG
jgi:hypothetical protein